jgi:uncharacterized membrane protein
MFTQKYMSILAGGSLAFRVIYWSVCEFPLDPLEITDRYSSKIIRLRQSLNPIETDALHERNTTFKTVFSTKIPASPVPLGLELMIAGDIIGTIIRPTLQEMAVLGSIVAVRTVISFFLNREIGKE